MYADQIRSAPKIVQDKAGGGSSMLSELASAKRVAGVKQSRKAIREGRAKRVYLACDADEAITIPLAAECAAAGIPVETRCTMAQIGTACRVAVGASAAVVLG
jgi:large subunit ribosomal protein L7A